MNTVKIFTEFGIGNASFINTEVEIGDRERRVRGCIRMRLRAVYGRVWIGQKVYLVSTNKGFQIIQKNRKTFKLILGFEGVPRRDIKAP